MRSDSCRARAYVAVRRPRHPASTQSLRRGPGTTVGALVDHPLRRQKIRGATRAVGAAEALRPFQPSKVLSAVVFIGEPTAELCLAARKFGYVHPAPQNLCSPYVLITVDALNASRSEQTCLLWRPISHQSRAYGCCQAIGVGWPTCHPTGIHGDRADQSADVHNPRLCASAAIWRVDAG